METKVDEVADGIYRFSTCIPGIMPNGFTFNQYLVKADEPLLFHTGMRGLFPLVSQAAAKVLPIAKLRWISFSHIEADESGALNEWLAAAPNAQVVHSKLGCDLSVNDLASRPPKVLEDGQSIDLGGKRVRLLMTPHVPHSWESIVLFEEQTRALLCGDILTTGGDGPAVSSADPVGPALETEKMFRAWSSPPELVPTLGRLADLEPTLLAAMHGSAYRGNGGKVLRDLASGLAKLAVARAG